MQSANPLFVVLLAGHAGKHRFYTQSDLLGMVSTVLKGSDHDTDIRNPAISPCRVKISDNASSAITETLYTLEPEIPYNKQTTTVGFVRLSPAFDLRVRGGNV